MTYLLDTNVCIDYLRGKAVGVRKRMESILPDDIILCSIVKAELFHGAMKSADPAIALANNVALVMHNTNEFKRVPGLQLEDWQA